MAAECDTKSLFHKTVKLHEWWLVWAENENHEKKLAIAGHTFCGQGAVRVFSSSPILRRHDVFTLETTDGIYVSILGLINKIRTEENGFPSEVFKCFFFGFPLQWEVCAEQYLAQGFVCNDISRDDSNLKGSTQTIEECNATNVGANVSPLSTDPKLDKDPALCPIREGSQTVMYGSEKDPGWEKTTDIEMESKLKENTDIREASKAERKAHNDVSSEDANLKGCRNANAQINVMTNARANVSLANTDPKLDQDHTACMILEGSKNSNEAIEYINRAGGAKDTAQKKTADIERESNFKENAIYEEASTAKEKTYNDVPSEDASLNGCSNASENTNEVNNTKANDTLANTNPELDQDQRKTAAIEKESIMEENTASKKESTAGNKTCTDPSRRLGEILKKSNKADRCRTRSGGPKNTTTTVKRESTSIKKAASKETSTPDKNTQRKLTYGSPVTPKADVGSPVTPKADVVTSFTSPGLSSVKRSRSGRLLLPTLEYWRNQTVVYDPNHQVIGVTDGISTPSRAELIHEPKRSEGRPKSKKDPSAATEKLPHEPTISVGRRKSKKDPDAAKATKKLTQEPKRSVGRPKCMKDPVAAKEKEIKSSRRR
ncbi:hypothetical protein POM88_006412 [Heracleum sosnowskyi]|uniref:SANTA domain-containing protein n=1 Tax=Heracleum sosnowskyi TaxID=360622 RepID=A0AAD8J2P1_9APIA|nr:hypothetical protein POM88_006412 [Heracleum sosnowskyi]